MADERSIELTIFNETGLTLRLQTEYLEPSHGKWGTRPAKTIESGGQMTCKSFNSHVFHGYSGNFFYESENGELNMLINFKKPYSTDKTTVEVQFSGEYSGRFGAHFIYKKLQEHHSKAIIKLINAEAKHAIKPDNIEGIFNKLDKNSKGYIQYNGSGRTGTPFKSHSQGYVNTGDYSIVSYNQADDTRGVLNIYGEGLKEYITSYEIPVDNMNHPGGCQGIGNFMVLGLQSSDYEKNKICFFNIFNVHLLSVGENSHITMLPLTMDITGSQKCDSVGITDLLPNEHGEFQYLLCASGGGKAGIYLSNYTKLGLIDPDLEFNQITTLSKISYSNIQLLTQSDGTVYLIAFNSKSRGLSYDDYIILYKFSGNFDENLSIEKIKEKHIYTNGPSIAWENPHCRYGAGIYIKDKKTIAYFVTNWQSAESFVLDTFGNKDA